MKPKEAFEFADTLNYFYDISKDASPAKKDGSPSLINGTLLKYLGPEKYKLFCRKLADKKLVTEAGRFKEGFIHGTVTEADIVSDENVRYYYKKSELTETVKALL